MGLSRVRRFLIALLIGVAAPIFPVVTYAGGGVGGGGGGSLGGLLVTVDAKQVPGHNYGFLDYFSRTVTVHQGDTITWVHAANQTEPHTVTLLPAGTPVTPAGVSRVYPGGGNPIPDRDDSARGGPSIPLGAFQPAGCGNSPTYPGTGPCSYDGHSVVNSGLLLAAPRPGLPAGAFSIRITAAPGVYHYYCLIHGPSMSGTIRVVGSSAPTDTQATVNARAARQYRAAWTHAAAHEAAIHPPASTINGHTIYTVLSGSQYGRVAIDEFIPSRLNLKPGDAVNWTPGFHTVTFPSESGANPFAIDCEVPGRDRPFRGSFSGCVGLELGFTPAGFPSGPPGKAYTGGFYNSGILVIPQPHPWSASFPSAGNFKYDCLVHPGMDAVITSG